MSISRNNHYIPQMYLQQWGTDNKIYVYRLLVSSPKVPIWTQKAISKTASMYNLYTRVSDGDELDDFEAKFNTKFETPAKIPLQKACNDERLSPEDWKILIDFLTAQYVRTPAFYNRIRSPLSQIVKSCVEDLDISRALDKKQTRNAISKDALLLSDELKLIPTSFRLTDIHPDDNHTLAEFEVIVGKSMWLFAIAHTLTDGSPIRTEMQNHKWTIVTSHNSVIWPTTDNPLVIFNPFFIPYGLMGLQEPGNIFIFPISPNKALISKNGKKLPPRWNASPEDSMAIKNLIVSNSFLYVYSKSPDNSIPSIKERKVDPKTYNKVEGNYQNWYGNYLSNEGPFLK